uniref:Beta-defensin n=1 Tax=Piliocolobus tephrosceles TaxID=591936 RepID=A0A8C9GMJ2_9PRIM
LSPQNTPVKLLTTICRLKLEKMYSKTNTSSTIFEKAGHGTEKITRSEGHHIIFNRWKACTAIGGRCRNQCDDSELRISYCERPTTHCCSLKKSIHKKMIHLNEVFSLFHHSINDL